MKYFNLKFLMVFLTLAVALPAMAQISGDDYYRVRNASTGKYIAIANDKFNYTTCIATAGGGLSQFVPFIGDPTNAKRRALACAGKYLSTDIHMVNDPDFILPGDIIYAEGLYDDADDDNDYNLIGQGTSLLTLTTGIYPSDTQPLNFSERYTNIKKSSGSGANTQYIASIYLKASNYSSADLGKRYFVDNNGTFAINESYSSTNAKWYVEKVYHFNVLPEVELNGKYYTTLKVPFAFTLSGSVEKAYAITAVNGGILDYQEITGTIPAGTPVLLQCSSPNAADCQLIPSGKPIFTAPDPSVTTSAPVADESSSYTGTNLLGGTYYCNTDGTITFETKSGTSSFTATHTTAASGKYIIGKDANGKLGFITATGNVEGNVMPANKAWMTSAGLFPTLNTPKITPASGTFTSAQTVTITATEGTIHYTTDGSEPTYQSPVYNGPITVGEGTTTIKAIAVKEGLYNNSDVASAEYVVSIPNPVLTVSPTTLAINDLGGSFTVNGTDLGTDNVGVTSSVFSTTTSDQNWGFNNNNGSVNGTVNVTYQGRELKATGTVNVANNMVSTAVDVTYQTDIYIVTDNGVEGNWNFNNGAMMTNEDGTYTATFNATLPNTFILFARKLGDGVNWNTRYVFGPSSDGDWSMPGDKATEYGNIDVNDDDPIKLPYAGEYTITINGNDKTFTITRTIETVATPTITPASGTYTGTQTVTIECETQDATILYKIDDGDYQPYNGSIEVAESCTITAKATKDGWNDSEEATTEYIIEIPVVHQPGDVNHDGEVNIKDVTDLIDYLLGMNDNVCTTCADVKADGDINISDVTTLIDMLLGI
ncbi:MAG: chitobiase/beta-hexosaminidase C-terminal domain-containing protein [Muribaculaceae bacterium]|nr:chitobiase/beta-hexosaminidase C-terminal domain-containing protein [Muribaculaceae bacterium]